MNNKTKDMNYTLICYILKVKQVMNIYGCQIVPSFALWLKYVVMGGFVVYVRNQSIQASSMCVVYLGKTQECPQWISE